jgi:GT2 family glycosyltransferase
VRTGASTGGVEAESPAIESGRDLGRPARYRPPGDEADAAARLPSPAGPLPSVSVVCATYQRTALLPAFVDAVLADPAATELIVVTADKESMRVVGGLRSRHARLRALQVAQPHHHAALDAAVAAATSEVVLLLDDDVLPGPGLATGHARHHARHDGLVVVGYMPVHLDGHPRPADVGAQIYARTYERHCDRIESAESGVLDELWTGNVSVRRADCIRVGLDSPGFAAFYHADRDLGLRLADAGLIGVFDRTLAASHLHRRSPSEFLRDSERQGSGRAALRRTQPQRLGDLDPALIVADLPRPLRAAVRIVGSTCLAGPSARTLIAIGLVLGYARCERAEVLCAKLARRVMQTRGLHSASDEVPLTRPTRRPVRLPARKAAAAPPAPSSTPPAVQR